MNDVLFTKEDSTILKGIAICLMIYYHVAACGNMIHNSLILTIWLRLGNFCVPMFAFLSAFGIISFSDCYYAILQIIFSRILFC